MTAAPDSHASDHVPGEMPIVEHTTTFLSVMGLFKWGSLALAAFLTLLIFWFCTPAGFLPGFIVAVIMVIAGIFFLREKPAAGH
jgi:hypothetical protein